MAANACHRKFMNEDRLGDNERVADDSIHLLLSQCPEFDLSKYPAYYEIDLHCLEIGLNLYYNKLKPQSHVILIVSDQRRQGIYYDIHSDITEILKRLGFVLQGITIIIDENKKLNTYGYPTTFVPNIVHQYAIIAKKVDAVPKDA